MPCFVNLPKDERVAIVYLQSNPYSAHNGIAMLRSICGSKMAASITRMKKRRNRPLPIAKTAITLAHEIAHNFGIYHDFENHEDKEAIKRTKTCGPPMNQGGEENLIMNYGRPRKPEWSDCSSDDFYDYFSRIVQHTSFCLTEDRCDVVVSIIVTILTIIITIFLSFRQASSFQQKQNCPAALIASVQVQAFTS